MAINYLAGGSVKKSKYVLLILAGAVAIVAVLARPASAITSAWLREANRWKKALNSYRAAAR